MKWLLGVIGAAVLFFAVAGCGTPLGDPRVMQCQKCGEYQCVCGGLFPGQGSRCPCGGRVVKVRDLSWDDYKRVKERGYVTLSDGEPVASGWTPNYGD